MLPQEFTERFERICPPDLLAASLASFSAKEAVAFRINRLRIADSTPVLAELAAAGVIALPVPWAHALGVWAYTCDISQREALTYTPAATSGDIYIQSLSSMLAPLLEEAWLPPQLSRRFASAVLLPLEGRTLGLLARQVLRPAVPTNA